MKNFVGVLNNLVDFWSEKMFVYIHIDPTKSFTATFVHLGLFGAHLYVLGRDTKVDTFATIRTYWAKVLKDPQLAEM